MSEAPPRGHGPPRGCWFILQEYHGIPANRHSNSTTTQRYTIIRLFPIFNRNNYYLLYWRKNVPKLLIFVSNTIVVAFKSSNYVCPRKYRSITLGHDCIFFHHKWLHIIWENIWSPGHCNLYSSLEIRAKKGLNAQNCISVSTSNGTLWHVLLKETQKLV